MHHDFQPPMSNDAYTEPDWERCALITIDVQHDTLDGRPFQVAGTSAILPSIAALLEAFRAAAKPIVHVVRLYRPDGSNVDLCRRAQVERGVPILLAGSLGAHLAREIQPRPNVALYCEVLLAGKFQRLGPQEVVMYKPRWGAFFATRLEAYLRRQGIRTLIFTGCNFPNCPRASIYEASERDFRVVLIEDAVSGFYERGRAELEGIGVRVLRSADVLWAVASERGGGS